MLLTVSCATIIKNVLQPIPVRRVILIEPVVNAMDVFVRTVGVSAQLPETRGRLREGRMSAAVPRSTEEDAVQHGQPSEAGRHLSF